MPASSSDSIFHIEDTLKASLAKSASSSHVSKPTLDQHLIASSRKVLMHNVAFTPAQKQSSFQLDSLRAKYTTLNPSGGHTSNGHSNGHSHSNGHGSGIVLKHEKKVPVLHDKSPPPGKSCDKNLPVPSRILFDPRKLQMSWPMVRPAGCGLRNMGNTCFLNSVLQALTYCAPLYNFLQKIHQQECQVVGFCMLCEMQRHTKRCLETNQNTSIIPGSILQKLKMIAKHMHFGRQEDAHELLRYVTDAMVKSALDGVPKKLDEAAQNTTAVHQIFGGMLRSQVQCLTCHTRFNKFDPCMDLNVDIKNSNRLVDSLRRFIKPDILEGDNCYSCSVCKKKTRARKSMTIHAAPRVLSIQLKRFGYGKFDQKINRHIEFPNNLDMRQFMSQSQGDPLLYELFAVIVHKGYSCSSGHYYAYIKAPDKTWYCMNDQCVQRSQLGTVLQQNDAYILSYIRRSSSHSYRGPQLQSGGPERILQNHTSSTTSHTFVKSSTASKPSTDVGVSVPRKLAVDMAKPATSLPTQREKVSFGFGVKSPSSSNQGSKLVIHNNSEEKSSKYQSTSKFVLHSSTTSNDGKPGGVRLTLQAKSPGKSETPKPSHGAAEREDRKSPVKLLVVKPSSSSDGPKRLVPYQDESSDEEDTTKVVQSQKVKDETPVLDTRLNTTLTAPGAYKRLDQELPSFKRDRKDTSPSKDFRLKMTSPSRRSVSESLSVTTSSSKVNATTPWLVFDAEPQSPSIASNSSCASVQSTSEWTTATCNGFHGGGLSHPDEAGEPCPKRGQGVGGSDLSPTLASGKSYCPGGGHLTSPTRHKDSFSCLASSFGQSASLCLDLGLSLQTDSEIPSNSLAQVTSKSEARKLPSTPDGCTPGWKVTTSESSQKRPGPVGNIFEKMSTMFESPKKSQDNNDEQDGSSSPRKRSSQSVDSSQESATDDATVPRKKHKKSKKHKKDKNRDAWSDNAAKYDDERPLLESDSSSAASSPEKSPVRRKDTDEGHNSVNSDPKENDKQKEKKAVPSQAWDAHIKDGFKQQMGSTSLGKGASVSGGSTWDGTSTGQQDVVKQLTKMSSARGFGDGVMSWEGNRSVVNQDVDADKAAERKRGWSDAYEEELDEGKMKKIKTERDHPLEHHQGNPFQQVHDYRQKNKMTNYDGHWHQQRPNHQRHNSRGGYHDRNSNFRGGQHNYRGRGGHNFNRGPHHNGGQNYGRGNNFRGGHRGGFNNSRGNNFQRGFNRSPYRGGGGGHPQQNFHQRPYQRW